MRSDNLRAAPRWITPEIVGRILALAIPTDERAVPVVQVPTRGVKPKLTVVETSFEPPSGGKIRSGKDGRKERLGAASRQSSGAARAVPAEPVSPIANPPVTHSRRSEEREAAAIGPTPAASPPRKSKPSAGTTRPAATPATAAETGPALHPVERGRLAHNELRAAQRTAEIEAERPLFKIAFERGIAIVDLAHALGQHQCTVALHTRLAGMRFGRRMPLADPLTREQLLTLADPAVPLPELRCARLKRQSREKWNAYAKNKRSADVARRAAERAAAAEERRKAKQIAKAEARRQRDLEREARRAAKPPKQQTPRQTSSREVQKAAVCRPVRPAPSREPAAPPPPAPRAQPIVVRQTPGAPRCVNYAETMNAAVAYLRARQFVVQRHSREEIIARWRVSGWSGLFSNQQLIELAVHHGLQVQA